MVLNLVMIPVKPSEGGFDISLAKSRNWNEIGTVLEPRAGTGNAWMAATPRVSKFPSSLLLISTRPCLLWALLLGDDLSL